MLVELQDSYNLFYFNNMVKNLELTFAITNTYL